jgi:hypothetical protein
LARNLDMAFSLFHLPPLPQLSFIIRIIMALR